ncbi:hypothetical protein SAMN05216268_110214 [Streptomyces yunnanensis]|uniref:Uncharacterized protein n=1 Tax=Streptomyces yunnanensis TaxID=156453 RepID=A0A9X8MZ37_9ACTN|nr:hypothetical protein SAMN05216268_110214 [Streptomyces yunnanensis]
MPIGPRYRRVSALQRQFFDREAALTAYDEALRGLRPTGGTLPRALNSSPTLNFVRAGDPREQGGTPIRDRVTTAGPPAGSGGTS